MQIKKYGGIFVKDIRKAGVYARISKEDIRKKHSESIENQKRLAQLYVQNSEDDIEIVSYYIDDGKTGTITDRPAYQQLLEDAKNKKINMIIVKDFSRLSRDSVDALKFIEYDIQALDIRFVSLGEGFDSLYSQKDDLKMAFLAVLNSTYPADISRKVSMSLDIKRQDGIFLKGMSKQSIAIYLNESGICCPTEYKKANHSQYQPAQKNYPFFVWTYSTIHKILSNEVYIGNLIQKKTKLIKVFENDKSRKKKVPIETGKEIKIEQTHQPIIDKKTFEQVQQLLKKRRRTIKKKENVALFSGILQCCHCKKPLYQYYSKNAKNEKIYYYRCSSYKNAPNIACTPHTIKEKDLIDILQYLLNLLFFLFLEKNLEEKNIEQKKYAEGKKRLLQAFANGIIEQQDILTYQEQSQKKIQKIKKSCFKKQELNHILLHYFVDTIIIEEHKKITISFYFSSPFLKINEKYAILNKRKKD